MKYNSSRWNPLRAANASNSVTDPAATPTTGPIAKRGTAVPRVSVVAAIALPVDGGRDVAEELRTGQHAVGAGGARGGRTLLVDVGTEAHQARGWYGGAPRGGPIAEAGEIDNHDVGLRTRVGGAHERRVGNRRADLRAIHEVAHERADPHRHMAPSPRRRRLGSIRTNYVAGAGLGGSGGTAPGSATANSGQRLRERRESLCISAIASGSSSPGRTSIAPSASIRSMSSRPASVRTIVSVQSLNLPMPPVEMSACSAAKSGHILQPSRAQAWHSFSGTSW